MILQSRFRAYAPKHWKQGLEETCSIRRHIASPVTVTRKWKEPNVHSWIDKQSVEHSHNGIAFSPKAEESCICYNVDEPGGYYAMWYKPGTNKANTGWFHLYEVFTAVSFIEITRMAVARPEELGTYCLMGLVSLLQDEKVLEACCTAMWIYVTLLHRMLKVIMMVKKKKEWVLYVSYISYTIISKKLHEKISKQVAKLFVK